MTFRANLQTLRAKRNMTQEQLAMLLASGVSAIITSVGIANLFDSERSIIGLMLLLLGVDHRLFWIPWPIGGLLCGVVGIVVWLFRDRLDR